MVFKLCILSNGLSSKNTSFYTICYSSCYRMKVLALLLPILIWTTRVNTEDVKETMGKVQEGIGATSEILGVLSETDVSTKFSRIAKVAAKVGPFLGAIGPAISIVTLFFPDSPSAELILMKKEFAKIDSKFDQVFEQFEDVKNLIRETSLNNQYSEYEHSILHLSGILRNLLKSNLTNDTGVYNRSFVTSYRSSYGGATDKLWRGMMKDMVVSDNIPYGAMIFTKYHRTRVQNIMKGILNLILQGVKVQLAYLKLLGHDYDVSVMETKWETKIKDLVYHMKSVDWQVKNKWYNQAKKDIKSELVSLEGKSNEEFANSLYSFLTQKFDWRDWHVVAYNDIIGGDKHWVKWCGGDNWFRENGRNLVVASVDEGKTAINTTATKKCLGDIKTRPCDGWWGSCYDIEAKKVYEEMPDNYRKGCTYAAVGVIRKDEDIAHKGPSDRLVTVDNGVYKLHAFG